MNSYIVTSSLGKLCFARKCILGKLLCTVTKSVGHVYNVSRSSAGCSEVCRNDCPRRSDQSDHTVAELGVKPLSAIIC